MMGLKPEDKWYYHEGKEAHRIIQDHVSGIKLDPRLSHIQKKFPIVEKVDFDPYCKFEFEVEGIKVIGFHDGRDKDYTKFLEIKSSSTPWSLGKFQKSMQRKLYGLANKNFKESYLITCKRKPEEWDDTKPKLFKVPVTNEDRKEATEWIIEALERIKAGQLAGGLEDGKCNDSWCYYGKNCQFK